MSVSELPGQRGDADIREDAVAPFKRLLDILECCVCLETVKVPFKQCSNGHLVCSECMKTLSTCPTCRGDSFVDNPITMKSLLEALPRPCRYSGAGCKEIVPVESDHVTYCGFRPVKCHVPDCRQKVTMSELKQHVTSKHDACLYNLNDGLKLSSYLASRIFPYEFGIPTFVMDSFFWLHFKNTPDNGLFRISFEAVFASMPDRDYYANFSFHKAFNSNIHSEFGLKASMLVNDERLDEDSTVEVPLSLLKKYSDIHGDIKYYCSFTSQPILKT